MRRRPLVAIFTAYALLLAPLLGAMAAYAPAHGFELCTSADGDAPANSPNHSECCLVGPCACAAPAMAPLAAISFVLPSHDRTLVAALIASTSRAGPALAAPPRGPPSRA
jgi:hypothetical protein